MMSPTFQQDLLGQIKGQIKMSKNNREVWNIGLLLARSKNSSYRDSVIRRESIIFKFFTINNLIKIDAFDSAGIIKHDLIVYVEDLTIEGLKLLSLEDCQPEFKVPPVLKWHNYIDRGGEEENMSILRKGLEQLQKKN